MTERKAQPLLVTVINDSVVASTSNHHLTPRRCCLDEILLAIAE